MDKHNSKGEKLPHQGTRAAAQELLNITMEPKKMHHVTTATPEIQAVEAF